MSVLRLWRARVVAPGFAETRDSSWPQHASELAQHFSLVRYVMKGIEADDPVHGFIGQLQRVAVELEEPLRQQFASVGRVLLEEPAADREGRRRRIATDHRTVQLRDQARQPARPRAEIEDGHRLAEVQPSEQRAQVFQHFRCLVHRLKGLAQGQIRILHHAVVLIGGLVQLRHRVAPHHLFRVDE